MTKADSFQWKHDPCPVWRPEGNGGFERCTLVPFHLGAHRDKTGHEWGPDRARA